MSTVFLYTCPEVVIRAAPKEQPRSLFVFTLRVDYRSQPFGVELLRSATTVVLRRNVFSAGRLRWLGYDRRQR